MIVASIVLGAVLLAPPVDDPSPASAATSTQPEAQPGPATHGRVDIELFERGTRDRLAGVSVFADAGAEPIAETDARGRARVWLEPGVRVLKVRAEGFEALELELALALGEGLELELRLTRDGSGRARYRTEVSSERAVAITSSRLRDEELHTVAGSGGDPFAVVKSLPGAAQVAGFLPYVVVRGAAPGNTGNYLDGVRVPALFHLALGPSVIHPSFIDEIDFYPGGVPVRLGRFASGLVEGRTKLAARDRVRGEVDVRLTDAGGLVELPFNRRRDPSGGRSGPGRGSLTLGGRYSYTGLLLAPFGVKLRYWDYQGRLDHRLGPRARYTAFVLGSYDSLGPTSVVIEEPADDAAVPVTVDEDPDPWVRLEFHRIDQRIR